MKKCIMTDMKTAGYWFVQDFTGRKDSLLEQMAITTSQDAQHPDNCKIILLCSGADPKADASMGQKEKRSNYHKGKEKYVQIYTVA